MDHQYYYHEHLLRLFVPLVYKTLARCNIHSAHIHYDDYWQELRIKLLQIAQNFDGQPLTNDDDRYRFTAYAQRGLYWHLIDLIRRDQRDLARQETPEDLQAFLENLSEPENIHQAPPSIASMYITRFIEQARHHLSEEEYQLFLLLTTEVGTYTEIAEILGITRENLYKRRIQLRRKLRPLKYLLKK